jgi:hypothetical protein
VKALRDPKGARLVGGGGDQHAHTEAAGERDEEGGQDRPVPSPPAGLGRREYGHLDHRVLCMHFDHRGSNSLTGGFLAEDETLGATIVAAEAEHGRIHTTREGALKQLRGLAPAGLRPAACKGQPMRGEQAAQFSTVIRPEK